MTVLGSFAQKWQNGYKNWLWKTINGGGNLKKIYYISMGHTCRPTGNRWTGIGIEHAPFMPRRM
jgi:hypothetical protein